MAMQIGNAVGWGSVDEVRRLLASGANADEKFKHWLPLNMAIEAKKRAVVDCLLEAGVNPNLADDYGKTPVYCATTVGDIELVRRLVSIGADIRTEFAPGNLVAVAVLWKGAFAIIPDLVKMGLDPNAYNSDGITPMMLAAANGNHEALEVLIRCGGELEKRDLIDGWTAYLHAVSHHQATEEDLLVRLGADIGVSDRFGRNADEIRRMH